MFSLWCFNWTLPREGNWHFIWPPRVIANKVTASKMSTLTWQQLNSLNMFSFPPSGPKPLSRTLIILKQKLLTVKKNCKSAKFQGQYDNNYLMLLIDWFQSPISAANKETSVILISLPRFKILLLLCKNSWHLFVTNASLKQKRHLQMNLWHMEDSFVLSSTSKYLVWQQHKE